MIVSASYRTDIPAFYGEWFINRLNAGYCKCVNPYGGPPYRVSLAREDVGGFVFWTKNLGPFLGPLKQVHQRGYPFIVQYSINNYPRLLEPAVTEARRSVEHMKLLATTYGPRIAVWRYDTVVVSSLTPVDFHRRNFEMLAGQLRGTTDEVTISFAQIYKKTKRNMDRAAAEFAFTWADPEEESKHALVRWFVDCAETNGITVSVCSQRRYAHSGAREAACIDARRLGVAAPRKGNRPECACYESRDIGAYDTCPQGCVYCYAVRDRAAAQRGYARHDPHDEFLMPTSLP